MDLVSLIDMDLSPLNKDELEFVKEAYKPRDLDSMNIKESIHLLKLLMSAQNKSLMYDKKFLLLIRRLNMIIDFRANPELLI